jgi:hypothetical protein
MRRKRRVGTSKRQSSEVFSRAVFSQEHVSLCAFPKGLVALIMMLSRRFVPGYLFQTKFFDQL